MSNRANNMFHIGELGGVLKTHTWEMGVDYVCIPPASLKSAIALNGKAEKIQISTALKVRFSLVVDQHDEADAAGLMVLGEMKLGLRKATAAVGKEDRFAGIRNATVVKGKLISISKSP